ncbi:MAG: CxxC-x17-CxxC domain-containing protein [Nitrosopumilaceae archaeon]
MPFDREREMFTATCGDCGNECQIPFKPKEDRPVYCRECFQNHKPAPRSGGGGYGGRSGGGYGGRSGGGYGGRSGGGYGGRSGGGRRDDRPREMFDAKCGDCGNECKIPFKPKEDRPVYCKECFQNHKQN